MTAFTKRKKMESFRAKMKVTHINYQQNDRGIFRCVPVESSEEVKLNWKGEFNLKGDVPYELKVDRVYTVLMGNVEYNDKFKNYTYEIDKFEVEQLSEPEEQFEFLETVVPPKIHEEFMREYGGQKIIDLILNDQIDVSRIKGIKETKLEVLKEKLDVFKDLGRLQILLAPLGMNIKAVTKIARHFGSPDRAFEKLSDSLYNLCEVKGYGFKKVDELCMKANVSMRDPIRISECLKYIIDVSASDGHSWSYKEDIVAESLEYLNIEPHLLDETLIKAIFDKSKSYRPNDIIMVGELVSLYRFYQDELRTMQNLDRIRNTYKIPSVPNLNRLILKAENELGITYTEEQRGVITDSINHGVCVIEGKAGSGKTTIIKGIVLINESLGRECIAATLSGKASNVLTSKGLDASTIHRLLGYNGDEFEFNENNHLYQEAINFDEAGMANANIWNSFTSAIADGTHFVISGDSGQLSAIGHGDVLRDILNYRRYMTYTLTQIHRQALDSGVIEIAHKVREGENITRYNGTLTDHYGNNQDLTIISRAKPKKDDVVIGAFMNEEEIKEAQNPIYALVKQEIQAKIAKILQSDNPEEGIMNYQIISPTKTAGALSVESLNKLVQREYNKSNIKIKLGNSEFKDGDKVIINGNTYRIPAYATVDKYRMGEYITDQSDYNDEFDEEPMMREHNLFNGTLGIIKYIDKEDQAVVVKFEGIDGLIALDDEMCKGLDLGYAITIHKSQGSGFDEVLLTFDYSAFKMLSRQLIYTGLTRTIKRCMMICENNALFKALQVDASGNRRTFMDLFLAQLEQILEQDEEQ